MIVLFLIQHDLHSLEKSENICLKLKKDNYSSLLFYFFRLAIDTSFWYLSRAILM